jgi:hypothetical protein
MADASLRHSRKFNWILYILTQQSSNVNAQGRKKYAKNQGTFPKTPGKVQETG